MNRRDFLGLFRGLAVLPFVNLPELPIDTPVIQPEATGSPMQRELDGFVNHQMDLLTDRDVEELNRLYEGLWPDASHIHVGYLNSGVGVTGGQAVYVSEYTGKLDVYNGDGHIIGVAARDIAPGETIEWVIGGNSKDIVTSGVAKIKVIDI